MSSDAPTNNALDDLAAEPATSPRHRFRFSLLALLLAITVIALSLGWLIQPNYVVATALFEVRNEQHSIIAKERPFSREDYELLKKTQIALLKSKYVLTSALINPGIASLSILGSSEDKEAWLQDHLEIEFPENGEILSISLRGTESQKADLTSLVDAIAAAYKKEVLGQERQRKLTIRDMVAKSLENLNSELKRKFEDYFDIVRGLNRYDGTNGDPFKEINTKGLLSIDAEIMRVEGEQLKNETAGEEKDAAFFTKRLEQLRKQKGELEKIILASTVRYADLETRKEELKQLQSFSNDMSLKLETLDIELETPPQIRQIQNAVITKAK